MKIVKATIKLEFETTDVDQESLLDTLATLLEYEIDSGDLVDKVKFLVTDEDTDDDQEVDFEAEED